MSIKIAVQGCCHGELDEIYKTIIQNEKDTGNKYDLLLVTGDFQSLRHIQDLFCLAVPEKYKKLNTFQDYVTGSKLAPLMTIFIGGNHEASNVLHSLYYGGFVAPNIYFLGFAGSVLFRGIRISGISGIYNEHHYLKGHYETYPYHESFLRSIYHVRQIDVLRILHLAETTQAQPINIFLSHDWPKNIWNYGDVNTLLKIKPYFKPDIDAGSLGSPPLKLILDALKPKFWFSSHLHVKFAAVFPHNTSMLSTNPEEIDISEESNTEELIKNINVTRFLALDKVLPNRDFIQFLEIPISNENPICQDKNIHFDFYWAAILRKSHHLLQINNLPNDLNLQIDEQFINETRVMLENFYGSKLIVPNIAPLDCCIPCSAFKLEGNFQTDSFLSALQLPHIWTNPLN